MFNFAVIVVVNVKFVVVVVNVDFIVVDINIFIIFVVINVVIPNLNLIYTKRQTRYCSY